MAYLFLVQPKMFANNNTSNLFIFTTYESEKRTMNNCAVKKVCCHPSASASKAETSSSSHSTTISQPCSKCRLTVTNLPAFRDQMEAQKSKLLLLFNQFGSVYNIEAFDLPKKNSAELEGVAYITFEQFDDCEASGKAMRELNRTDFEGKMLYIDLVTTEKISEMNERRMQVAAKACAAAEKSRIKAEKLALSLARVEEENCLRAEARKNANILAAKIQRVAREKTRLQGAAEEIRVQAEVQNESLPQSVRVRVQAIENRLQVAAEEIRVQAEVQNESLPQSVRVRVQAIEDRLKDTQSN